MHYAHDRQTCRLHISDGSVPRVLGSNPHQTIKPYHSSDSPNSSSGAYVYDDMMQYTYTTHYSPGELDVKTGVLLEFYLSIHPGTNSSVLIVQTRYIICNTAVGFSLKCSSMDCIPNQNKISECDTEQPLAQQISIYRHPDSECRQQKLLLSLWSATSLYL